MTRWDARVTEHPVNERLAELAATVDEIRSAVAGENLSEVTRLQRVVAEARAKLGADPELVTKQMLDNLQKGIDQTLALIRTQQQAASQGQPLDVGAVNDRADAVLNNLANWPSLSSSQEAESLGESLTGLRDTSQTVIQGLGETVGAYTAEIKRDSEKHRQAASELTRELDQLKASIDNQKSRLDAALQAQEATFSEGQEQRRQQFDAFNKELRETSASTLEQIKTEAGAEAKSSSEKAASRMKELEELLGKAREVVGVIARTGMAGGYQEDADSEEKAANRWRNYTVAAALAAATVLMIAVYTTSFDAFSPARLIVKAALSATFGGLAAYTARQSAQHRDEARRAKNLQLALASIGPYLQNVDEKKRAIVFEAFTYLFFAPPPGRKDESEAGPGQLQAFLDLIQRSAGDPG